MEPNTTKKKRGRPRKIDGAPSTTTTQTKPVANEKKKQVTMDKDVEYNIAPSPQEIKNQVGEVHSVPEDVTLSNIQQRWRSVFSKYGTLSFNSIMQSWGDKISMLKNPYIQNDRVKQINASPVKYSKEELGSILADPQHNEVSLQSASLGLYYVNYVYQMLIQLNRNTPLYNYYATPLYLDPEKSSVDIKKSIKRDSVKVDKLLKKFNPALTFKTVATQVYQQGKCSYLVRTSHKRDDVAFLLLQKLNSNMVKITSFGSKQQFIASFNMSIFLQPGYDVSQYPPFIQDTWQIMQDQGIVAKDKRGRLKINPAANLPLGHMIEASLDGGYIYWVQLPQDLCYTFYSDGSHPNAFPETIGLFNDLNDLDDYRWLQGNLLSRGINAVLTAEVPLTKDPKAGSDSTAISPDTILGYQDFFAQSVSQNIMSFFAPFENFKLHSMDNEPESLNIIYSRIRDLIATSGNSAILSLTEKPTVSSTKAAELVQAGKNDYLTRQFEQFLDNVINENFKLENYWHITLHSDIFFWREDAKQIKEMVISGAKQFTPRLLSYYRMSLEDFEGSKQYMDALGVELIIKDSAGELSEEKNPVGRPPIDPDDLENDNTAISIDAGNNVSDTKEFTLTEENLEGFQVILDELGIEG